MTQEYSETLKPKRPRRERSIETTPALTVVFHPDATRVGARVRLPELGSGGRAEISRLHPLFAQPGVSDEAGLADPCVSRKPLVLWRANPRTSLLLRGESGGMHVVVDGVPITNELEIHPGQLAQGVVIELAERVVLLLHELPLQESLSPSLGLVGANPAMDQLRRSVLRVAELDVPVLIRGETGAGKELVARAVHQASGRRDALLVSVNMAAIPASTAAAALFGHAKGAFTGADVNRQGYFQRARGGSLFLDEIGATAAQVQPMLLRALESGEVQMVGAPDTERVDARLIAATDSDLGAPEHGFSPPLRNRLESYQLRVPPLRERRDDIGRLLMHFVQTELQALNALDRLRTPLGADAPWLPASLVGELVRLDWPGNVRQLRNVARYIAIENHELEHVCIDAGLSRLLADAGADDLAAPQSSSQSLSEDAIVEALRRNEWRVAQAATELGVSRTYMYDRVKQSARVRSAQDIDVDEIRTCLASCEQNDAEAARRLEVPLRALRRRIKQLEL